jgi:predicted KAP-like P-loop ATPase
LAERVLQERYPAERHFLEKIVQASFEVPLPDPEILHDALLHSLVGLAGHPEQKEGVRFRNILIDVVNPLITLPRDLGRFLGNFGVSWAAIGKEVDLADLTAVEALRLFRLPTYQAIRSHKAMLCGTSDSYSRQRSERESYDAIFLSSASDEGERQYLRTALRRLFPRLDSVWSNVHYSSSGRTWRAQRRICDPGHFSSYFRLALGNSILPRKLIDELFESMSDSERIKEFFRERAKRVSNNGRTEIPIILDDILGLSDRISKEQAVNLLRALFAIADEIDLQADEGRGPDDLGNQIRIHWLINELVRDRLPQAERSVLFTELVPDAALGWAVSLVSRMYADHHPRSPDRPTAEDARLVDETSLSWLVEIMGERLRIASENGELLELRHFLSVLYRWMECFGASEEDIHRWTDSQLQHDRFILRMAEAVTTTS